MSAFEQIALIVIGFVAGGVGGMLGVGGSIVMIPAMTEVLGPNQHLYQAAAMIVNFFVVAPAVWQHHKARAIEAAAVFRFVPMALVGVLVGVGLSEISLFTGEGEDYLRGLFGLFLLTVAAIDLLQLLRSRRQNGNTTADSAAQSTQLSPAQGSSNRTIGWARASLVALPTGLVAGLLGVGGGVMAVPLQCRLLHIPIRTAIANSATIIIATSLVGATAKNLAYGTETNDVTGPLWVAALLIPTAIVGSVIGSRLTHRLPMARLKAAFFALLIVAGVRLMAAAL